MAELGGPLRRNAKEELQKTAEIPGSPEHASSGQVLTVAGILRSVYDEIAAK